MATTIPNRCDVLSVCETMGSAAYASHASVVRGSLQCHPALCSQPSAKPRAVFSIISHQTSQRLGASHLVSFLSSSYCYLYPFSAFLISCLYGSLGHIFWGTGVHAHGRVTGFMVIKSLEYWR